MSARRAVTVPKIVHPKALPSEVPWTPDYEYECPKGHAIGASRPVTRCPLATCGRELRRVGKGSRKTTAA